MAEQVRLRIERKMHPHTVVRIVEILSDIPGGPTMSVQRGASDNESVVFFSKRTYDYLERKLRDMKLEGYI